MECLVGDCALVGLVVSLMDFVKVLISLEVSEFGVSECLSSGPGLLEVSILGPHVSKLVAMNSCLKSGCAIQMQSVMQTCFFLVAMFRACMMSPFCLMAWPESNSWHECKDPLN